MHTDTALENSQEISFGKSDVAAHLIVYLTFILHIFVALRMIAGNSSSFDFLFFALISVLAPPVVAFVFILTAPPGANSSTPRLALVKSSSVVVITVSFVISTVSVLQWAFNLSADSWQPFLLKTMVLTSLIHICFLAALLGTTIFRKNYGSPVGLMVARAAAIRLDLFTVLSIALVGVLLGFQMNGKLPFFGGLFSVFSELRPTSGTAFTIFSIIFGPALVLFVIFLARTSFSDSVARNARRDNKILLIALFAVPLVFLDLRFNSDVLHFLTNAGPANQMLRSGGIPLVDTYSQYGLGPLVMTWLAFILAGAKLHAANLMAQAHSLVFYCCILICIYRITTHKRAAMLLGFFSIAVLLSGWWYGNYSLNSVPSSMGMRYLPSALLVLAISLLKERQNYSPFLVFSMTLSMLWSTEIFIASVAIVSLYIILEFARSLNVRSLARSVIWCILLPFVLAAMLVSAMTILLASGQFPNLAPVFDFLKTYNMTSEFWSIAASGQFFGWLVVASTVGATLSSAWYLALNTGLGKIRHTEIEYVPGLLTIAVRRYSPLAGLTIVMSSYYVGRSVDFTLIIAFLPFAGLFIPAFLTLAHNMNVRRMPSFVLAGLLASLIAVLLTFALLAVFRQGGPYRPLITELVRGNLGAAAKRYASRPMIDPIANPNFADLSGLASEALRAIRLFAPDQKKLVLLLGKHPTTPWSVHSDMVLILAGIGNRLPLSYVLSDELSPSRTKQILNHIPVLQNGEVILVRADESFLGPLEAKILRKIRSQYRLEKQQFDGTMVSVYIVANSR